MTVPSERTRAVLQTEQFLVDLTDPKKTPRIPRSIRKRALSLLRHYPCKYHMERIVETENALENPFGGVFGGGL